MMIVLRCDGCHADGTAETLTRVGRLDEVLYCSQCLQTWRATEANLEAKLIALRRAFETHRVVVERATGLKKTPDG